MKTGKIPRVLFLPKWYPNRYDPLDGIFIVDHAKAAAAVAEVYVLFIHSDPDLVTRTKTIVTTVDGLTVQETYFRYRRTGITAFDSLQVAVKYLFHQFSAYRKLRGTWGKPDLIHVHV